MPSDPAFFPPESSLKIAAAHPWNRLPRRIPFDTYDTQVYYTWRQVATALYGNVQSFVQFGSAMFGGVHVSAPIQQNVSHGASTELGRKLNAERLKRGLDLGDLADRAGVSRTTLYQICRGGVQKPRCSTLRKLADALGVPVAVLAEQSAATPLPFSAGNHEFDRYTNYCVQDICEERPELFAGWTEDEWDELYSTFGTGGELTPQGVCETARHINRKREVIRRLSIVLETHLADVAVSVIDSLLRMLTPVGSESPGSNAEEMMNDDE